MKEIGLKTRLKPMFEQLLAGHNPIIMSNKAVYVLTAEFYHDGWFAYTKFVDDEAVYSVKCNFSFRDDLEAMLRKGEAGLYGFIEPLIIEIPDIFDSPDTNPPSGC